jgi:large subunit ribosomal protein L21
MYAVVKTGGKQYRVKPGDVFVVERLGGQAGDQVKLDQVLMMGEDGKAPQIGAPLLGSMAVTCEVLDQNRADKVIIFKKKRRQGYKRTAGHRQLQTVLRVLDINGQGAVEPVAQARIEARAKRQAPPPVIADDDADEGQPKRRAAAKKAPAKKAAAKKAPAARKKAPAKKVPAKKAAKKK